MHDPMHEPVLDTALEHLSREKAGFLPPFLTRAELDDCLAAWDRLFNDPEIELENKNFIVDHKLYREPAFARVATHPVVRDAARRVIGEHQLVGYSVVAKPPNGAAPDSPSSVSLHNDHCVYSDVPVPAARDTFVCIWINFEDLAIENGPFCLAVGTDRYNIGWEFFEARPGLKPSDMGWQRHVGFNTGPAGSTAVYSGKTWHSGTTNCSQRVRKGLNLNFVPSPALDSRKRNRFDACALSEADHQALDAMLGVPGLLVPREPALAV